MATYGYKLYDDDSFCEVIEYFKDKYPNTPLDEILSKLRSENEVDSHIRQLAIAECLWRTNLLREEDILTVKELISSDVDHQYWAELGADEVFLSNRAQEVQKFYDRICYPPKSNQIWKVMKTTIELTKGECYWYRYNGCIYGAIVLEKQGISDPYYLIAISEKLDNIPLCISEITDALIFTAAWFSKENLLPPKRMHIVGQACIKGNFINKYGLTLTERSIKLTNCGQSFTWAHTYRAMNFRNQPMSFFVR